MGAHFWYGFMLVVKDDRVGSTTWETLKNIELMYLYSRTSGLGGLNKYFEVAAKNDFGPAPVG
jgi:hypothetical protein